jgi:two-component system, NarL family, invasion response regulator UvrY
MKILIVDDHEVVHHGLKRILEGEFPDSDFGDALHSQQALDLVRRESWNVVILDIRLPGPSGLDVLKDIRAVRPGLPVVMFSTYPEEQYAQRAFKAGASGYLGKECSSRQVIEAIVKVVSGGKYVSPKLAEYLVGALAEDIPRAPHETLSDREFEVLRMMSEGKSATAIAHQLSLSLKTVSTYRTRILGKLHLKSSFDLLLYALDHGIVSR